MTSTGPAPASREALTGDAAAYLDEDAVVRGPSVRPQAMAAIAAAYAAPVRTLVGAGLVAGALLGLVGLWFGLRQLTDRDPSLVLGVVGVVIGLALLAAAAWFARGLLSSGRALLRAQRRWFAAAPSLPAPESHVLGRSGAVVRLAAAGAAVLVGVVALVLLLRDDPGTVDAVVAGLGLAVLVLAAVVTLAGLLRMQRVAAAAPAPTAAGAFAPFGAGGAGPGAPGAPGGPGYHPPDPGRSAYGQRLQGPPAGPGAPPAPPGAAPVAGPAPGPGAAPWQQPATAWGPGAQAPVPGAPSGPPPAPQPGAPRHETIAWAGDAPGGPGVPTTPAPPAPGPAVPHVSAAPTGGPAAAPAPPSTWQPPDTEPAPAGGPDPDSDVESTRLTRAAAAAVVADTTTRGSRTEVVVVLEDDRRLAVDTVSLVGRDPRERAGEHAGAAVPVEHATVSRTHATFRVTSTSVHVTDRASTNGTSVVTPDGVTRELRAWAEEPVVVGSEVLLGSYRIRVLLAEDAG